MTNRTREDATATESKVEEIMIKYSVASRTTVLRAGVLKPFVGAYNQTPMMIVRGGFSFGWIWVASMLVIADEPQRRFVENLEGVELELRLDEQEQPFLEPIYGFIVLRNVSGHQKWMLSLKNSESFGLRIGRCDDANIDHIGGGIIDDPGLGRLRIRPVGFREQIPFMISCTDRQFILDVLAELPLRVSIREPIILEGPLPPKRHGAYNVYDEDLDSDSTIVGVETHVVLKINPRRSVFRDSDSNEARRFSKASSWVVHNHGYNLYDHIDAPRYAGWMRCKIPLLHVFSHAGISLLKELNPNTATRRFLTLWELPSDDSIDVKNPKSLEELLDAFVRLLIECGPAEAVMLRSKMVSYLYAASLEASPRNDTRAWARYRKHAGLPFTNV